MNENDVLFQKVTQAYSEKKSECSYQESNLIIVFAECFSYELNSVSWSYYLIHQGAVLQERRHHQREAASGQKLDRR